MSRESKGILNILLCQNRNTCSNSAYQRYVYSTLPRLVLQQINSTRLGWIPADKAGSLQLIQIAVYSRAGFQAYFFTNLAYRRWITLLHQLFLNNLVDLFHSFVSATLTSHINTSFQYYCRISRFPLVEIIVPHKCLFVKCSANKSVKEFLFSKS